MKNAAHRTLLFSVLLSLSFAPTAARAGEPEQPSSVQDLTSYEFVVQSDGDEHTMRIKDNHYGLIGDGKSGYIKYRTATWQGKEIVQINMIEGVKGVKGVGKLLKQEVLKRHKNKTLKSDLVAVNRDKLLKKWAKGYPHSSSDTNGKLFRGVVPAVDFEGFDYIITPKFSSTGTGGSIQMEMKAARKGSKGSIRIEDPLALDKILVTTNPEWIRAKDRPKSDKELKEDQKDNEAGAKKADGLMEKLADKVSKKEGVDEDDLLEHLRKMMDKECGSGGRDGTGWAQDCLFTAKGSSFVVKTPRSSTPFSLDRWMDDEAEEFVDDNT